MKKLLKKAAHDFNNRDMAIVYIDGEVYEDSTHAICLQKYLNDTGQGNIKNFKDRPEVEIFSEISKEHGGQDVILAHRVDNAGSIYYIYGLDDGKEMGDNKIIYLLGDAYPDYEIINDLEHDEEDNHGYDEEIQTNKSTRRISEFSLKNYKNVIESNGLKVDLDDNYIYNEYIGFELIPESQVIIPVSIIPIYDENSKFDLDEIEDLMKELISECKPVYEIVAKLGYVFDETELLYGSSFSYVKELNDGSSIILNSSDQGFEFEFKNFSSDKKEQLRQMGIEEKISFYPNELEGKTKTIEGLIQQGENKMKRLKIAEHDWNNRDMAILYVNGETYEDVTHAMCLQRYIKDNDIEEELESLQFRPDFEQFSEISEMNDGQDVILAHRVDNVDSIYFIYGLNDGKEMSDNEIINLLDEVYPEYKIINDLEHDDSDDHGYNEEEQIEKGKQRIEDYQNGNFIKYLNDAGYKKANDEMYYNNYCLIKIDNDDKTFTFKGMLQTDFDDFIFEFYSVNDVSSDMKKRFETIYNQLEEYGFELNESNLINNETFSYSKMINSGEIELLGGEQQLMISFYGFDKTILQNLENSGIENDSYIDVQQLPTILEICEKKQEAKLNLSRFKRRK